MAEEAPLRALVKEQVDALTRKIEELSRELHNRTHDNPPFPGEAGGVSRSMRLDVPRFHGADPEAWIFAMEEFFAFQGTPVDKKLPIVGFNLDGEAAEWFRWMRRNNLITTWDCFLESYVHGLGPPSLKIRKERCRNCYNGDQWQSTRLSSKS